MFGKRRRIREWLWDNYVALLERKGYTAIHSLLDIHGKRRFMSAIKPKD